MTRMPRTPLPWDHKVTIVCDARRAKYACKQLRIKAPNDDAAMNSVDACETLLRRNRPLTPALAYTLERDYRRYCRGQTVTIKTDGQ